MIEKTVDLEGVNLLEFMGVGNAHIKEIAGKFPTAKIVARGEELRIKGSEQDVEKISDLVETLSKHLQKHGRVNVDQIRDMLDSPSPSIAFIEDDMLLMGTKGQPIKAKTQNQIKMVEGIKKYDVMFALGPAGTGKTYTAVALAVQALKARQVKKIIITRPVVEAGENLGFLPGDLKDKIDPYLRPIYDALDDMIPAEKLKFYLENRIVEIAPLAYMRGRTLNNAFILLDEAQNTTPMQIKMFLTRMGPSSKTIITGDGTQIDLPVKQKSGLADAKEILKDIEGIGFVYLDGKDVLRHKLVKDIIEAYEKSEARKRE